MASGLHIVSDFSFRKGSVATASNSVAKQVQRSLNTVNFDNHSLKEFHNSLGRITGRASEFRKSMDAATARVFAFGATATVLNAVSTSFRALLSSTIEVEKKLIEINSIMGASAQTFSKFRTEIFNVAKNTGNTFNEVANGAAELARQGLSAEDTVKRLNAALILTRISGLDSASSVNAITAAINGFKTASLTADQIVNKLVAVDTAFAVSSKDLAEGFQRAGSTAEDAGVSFDQLLGIITAVQQKTARGGAVIGNALKSVFTRLSRSSTIDELKALGVQIDASQNGIQKLQALSSALERLGDSTQASKLKELAGGVYQINIVSAALKDLSETNSLFSQATAKSSQATNEAFKKNEALGKSLSSQLNELLVNITNIGQEIGKLTISPLIGSFLEQINKFLSKMGSVFDPETGNKFIQNIFKGIGTFISGPGIILIAAAFGKIFSLIKKFATEGLGEVFKIGSETEKIKNIEDGIVGLLQKDKDLREAIKSNIGDALDKHKLVEDAILKENALLKQQSDFISSIAKSIQSKGVYSVNDQVQFLNKKGKPIESFAKGNVRSGLSYSGQVDIPTTSGIPAKVRAKEIREARNEGAKGPIKILKSTIAKIGGQPFVYNDQEDVIARPNKDALVIPRYGKRRTQSSRFSKNFAGGYFESKPSTTGASYIENFERVNNGVNFRKDPTKILENIELFSGKFKGRLNKASRSNAIRSKGIDSIADFDETKTYTKQELKDVLFKEGFTNKTKKGENVSRFFSRKDDEFAKRHNFTQEDTDELNSHYLDGKLALRAIQQYEQEKITKGNSKDTEKKLLLGRISKYALAFPDFTSRSGDNFTETSETKSGTSLLGTTPVKWTFKDGNIKSNVASYVPEVGSEDRAKVVDRFRTLSAESAYKYVQTFLPDRTSVEKIKESNAEGSKGSIGSLIGGVFESSIKASLGLKNDKASQSAVFDIYGGDLNEKVRKLFGLPQYVTGLELKGNDTDKNFNSFISKVLTSEYTAVGIDNLKADIDSQTIKNFGKGNPLYDVQKKERGARLSINSIRKHGLLIPYLNQNKNFDPFGEGFAGTTNVGGKEVRYDLKSFDPYWPIISNIDGLGKEYKEDFKNKFANEAFLAAKRYSINDNISFESVKDAFFKSRGSDGGVTGAIQSGIGSAFQAAIETALSLNLPSKKKYDNFDVPAGTQNMKDLKFLVGAGGGVEDFEIKSSISKGNLQDFVRKVLNYEYKGKGESILADAEAGVPKNFASGNIPKALIHKEKTEAKSYGAVGDVGVHWTKYLYPTGQNGAGPKRRAIKNNQENEFMTPHGPAIIPNYAKGFEFKDNDRGDYGELQIFGQSEDFDIGSIGYRKISKNGKFITTVSSSSLDKRFRRQGIGSEAYKTLIKKSLKDGDFASDQTVSFDAARVYSKLADDFLIGFDDDSYYSYTNSDFRSDKSDPIFKINQNETIDNGYSNLRSRISKPPFTRILKRDYSDVSNLDVIYNFKDNIERFASGHIPNFSNFEDDLGGMKGKDPYYYRDINSKFNAPSLKRLKRISESLGGNMKYLGSGARSSVFGDGKEVYKFPRLERPVDRGQYRFFQKFPWEKANEDLQAQGSNLILPKISTHSKYPTISTQQYAGETLGPENIHEFHLGGMENLIVKEYKRVLSQAGPDSPLNFIGLDSNYFNFTFWDKLSEEKRARYTQRKGVSAKDIFKENRFGMVDPVMFSDSFEMRQRGTYAKGHIPNFATKIFLTEGLKSNLGSNARMNIHMKEDVHTKERKPSGFKELLLDKNLFQGNPQQARESAYHEIRHAAFSLPLIRKIKEHDNLYPLNKDGEVSHEDVLKKYFFNDENFYQQLLLDTNLQDHAGLLVPHDGFFAYRGGHEQIIDEILRTIEDQSSIGRKSSVVQRSFIKSLEKKGFLKPNHFERVQKRFKSPLFNKILDENLKKASKDAEIYNHKAGFDGNVKTYEKSSGDRVSRFASGHIPNFAKNLFEQRLGLNLSNIPKGVGPKKPYWGKPREKNKDGKSIWEEIDITGRQREINEAGKSFFPVPLNEDQDIYGDIAKYEERIMWSDSRQKAVVIGALGNLKELAKDGRPMSLADQYNAGLLPPPIESMSDTDLKKFVQNQTNFPDNKSLTNFVKDIKPPLSDRQKYRIGEANKGNPNISVRREESFFDPKKVALVGGLTTEDKERLKAIQFQEFYDKVKSFGSDNKGLKNWSNSLIPENKHVAGLINRGFVTKEEPFVSIKDGHFLSVNPLDSNIREAENLYSKDRMSTVFINPNKSDLTGWHSTLPAQRLWDSWGPKKKKGSDVEIDKFKKIPASQKAFEETDNKTKVNKLSGIFGAKNWGFKGESKYVSPDLLDTEQKFVEATNHIQYLRGQEIDPKNPYKPSLTQAALFRARQEIISNGGTPTWEAMAKIAKLPNGKKVSSRFLNAKQNIPFLKEFGEKDLIKQEEKQKNLRISAIHLKALASEYQEDLYGTLKELPVNPIGGSDKNDKRFGNWHKFINLRPYNNANDIISKSNGIGASTFVKLSPFLPDGYQSPTENAGIRTIKKSQEAAKNLAKKNSKKKNPENRAGGFIPNFSKFRSVKNLTSSHQAIARSFTGYQSGKKEIEMDEDYLLRSNSSEIKGTMFHEMGHTAYSDRFKKRILEKDQDIRYNEEAVVNKYFNGNRDDYESTLRSVNLNNTTRGLSFKNISMEKSGGGFYVNAYRGHERIFDEFLRRIEGNIHENPDYQLNPLQDNFVKKLIDHKLINSNHFENVRNRARSPRSNQIVENTLKKEKESVLSKRPKLPVIEDGAFKSGFIFPYRSGLKKTKIGRDIFIKSPYGDDVNPYIQDAGLDKEQKSELPTINFGDLNKKLKGTGLFIPRVDRFEENFTRQKYIGPTLKQLEQETKNRTFTNYLESSIQDKLRRLSHKEPLELTDSYNYSILERDYPRAIVDYRVGSTKDQASDFLKKYRIGITNAQFKGNYPLNKSEDYINDPDSDNYSGGFIPNFADIFSDPKYLEEGRQRFQKKAEENRLKRTSGGHKRGITGIIDFDALRDQNRIQKFITPEIADKLKEDYLDRNPNKKDPKAIEKWKRDFNPIGEYRKTLINKAQEQDKRITFLLGMSGSGKSYLAKGGKRGEFAVAAGLKEENFDILRPEDIEKAHKIVVTSTKLPNIQEHFDYKKKKIISISTSEADRERIEGNRLKRVSEGGHLGGGAIDSANQIGGPLLKLAAESGINYKTLALDGNKFKTAQEDLDKKKRFLGINLGAFAPTGINHIRATKEHLLKYPDSSFHVGVSGGSTVTYKDIAAWRKKNDKIEASGSDDYQGLIDEVDQKIRTLILNQNDRIKIHKYMNPEADVFGTDERNTPATFFRDKKNPNLIFERLEGSLSYFGSNDGKESKAEGDKEFGYLPAMGERDDISGTFARNILSEGKEKSFDAVKAFGAEGRTFWDYPGKDGMTNADVFRFRKENIFKSIDTEYARIEDITKAEREIDKIHFGKKYDKNPELKSQRDSNRKILEEKRADFSLNPYLADIYQKYPIEIPSFAKGMHGALKDAIGREAAALGGDTSKIRVQYSSSIQGPRNPMGAYVTNTRDEPTGFVPHTALRKGGWSKSKVPNFADFITSPDGTSYDVIGDGKLRNVSTGNIVTIDVENDKWTETLVDASKTIKDSGGVIKDATKEFKDAVTKDAATKDRGILSSSPSPSIPAINVPKINLPKINSVAAKNQLPAPSYINQQGANTYVGISPSRSSLNRNSLKKDPTERERRFNAAQDLRTMRNYQKERSLPFYQTKRGQEFTDSYNKSKDKSGASGFERGFGFSMLAPYIEQIGTSVFDDGAKQLKVYEKQIQSLNKQISSLNPETSGDKIAELTKELDVVSKSAERASESSAKIQGYIGSINAAGATLATFGHKIGEFKGYLRKGFTTDLSGKTIPDFQTSIAELKTPLQKQLYEKDFDQRTLSKVKMVKQTNKITGETRMVPKETRKLLTTKSGLVDGLIQPNLLGKGLLKYRKIGMLGKAGIGAGILGAVAAAGELVKGGIAGGLGDEEKTIGGRFKSFGKSYNEKFADPLKDFSGLDFSVTENSMKNFGNGIAKLFFPLTKAGESLGKLGRSLDSSEAKFNEHTGQLEMNTSGLLRFLLATEADTRRIFGSGEGYFGRTARMANENLNVDLIGRNGATVTSENTYNRGVTLKDRNGKDVKISSLENNEASRLQKGGENLQKRLAAFNKFVERIGGLETLNLKSTSSTTTTRFSKTQREKDFAPFDINSTANRIDLAKNEIDYLPETNQIERARKQDLQRRLRGTEIQSSGTDFINSFSEKFKIQDVKRVDKKAIANDIRTITKNPEFISAVEKSNARLRVSIEKQREIENREDSFIQNGVYGYNTPQSKKEIEADNKYFADAQAYQVEKRANLGNIDYKSDPIKDEIYSSPNLLRRLGKGSMPTAGITNIERSGEVGENTWANYFKYLKGNIGNNFRENTGGFGGTGSNMTYDQYLGESIESSEKAKRAREEQKKLAGRSIDFNAVFSKSRGSSFDKDLVEQIKKVNIGVSGNGGDFPVQMAEALRKLTSQYEGADKTNAEARKIEENNRVLLPTLEGKFKSLQGIITGAQSRGRVEESDLQAGIKIFDDIKNLKIPLDTGDFETEMESFKSILKGISDQEKANLLEQRANYEFFKQANKEFNQNLAQNVKGFRDRGRVTSAIDSSGLGDISNEKNDVLFDRLGISERNQSRIASDIGNKRVLNANKITGRDFEEQKKVDERVQKINEQYQSKLKNLEIIPDEETSKYLSEYNSLKEGADRKRKENLILDERAKQRWANLDKKDDGSYINYMQQSNLSRKDRDNTNNFLVSSAGLNPKLQTYFKQKEDQEKERQKLLNERNAEVNQIKFGAKIFDNEAFQTFRETGLNRAAAGGGLEKFDRTERESLKGVDFSSVRSKLAANQFGSGFGGNVRGIIADFEKARGKNGSIYDIDNAQKKFEALKAEGQKRVDSGANTQQEIDAIIADVADKFVTGLSKLNSVGTENKERAEAILNERRKKEANPRLAEEEKNLAKLQADEREISKNRGDTSDINSKISAQINKVNELKKKTIETPEDQVAAAEKQSKEEAAKAGKATTETKQDKNTEIQDIIKQGAESFKLEMDKFNADIKFVTESLSASTLALPQIAGYINNANAAFAEMNKNINATKTLTDLFLKIDELIAARKNTEGGGKTEGGVATPEVKGKRG